mmetsp:Transcript_1846/g.5828  ORF Transcript_1846/g.5828 Transcript_1846/m.5828 type:complete len:340 (+) Transcript_1846:53-1072(+)
MSDDVPDEMDECVQLVAYVVEQLPQEEISHFREFVDELWAAHSEGEFPSFREALLQRGEAIVGAEVWRRALEKEATSFKSRNDSADYDVESWIKNAKELNLPDYFSDSPRTLKKLNPRICEMGCCYPVSWGNGQHRYYEAKKMCECCHSAFYCTEECHRNHWAAHKRNCGKHGIARQYRGEASWIAAVAWSCVRDGSRVWFPLCVHRDDTVDDVKKKIRRRFDLALSDQVLKARPACTASFVEIEMGGSFWRVPGTGRGTLADFEVSRKEILILETECAGPKPTCEWCRQCIGGACRLEAGPDPNDAKHFPPLRQKPEAQRNDPCPCGSGKKYKKCCGR